MNDKNAKEDENMSHIFIKCPSCGTLNGYPWAFPKETFCKICGEDLGPSSYSSNTERSVAEVEKSLPIDVVEENKEMIPKYSRRKGIPKKIISKVPETSLALPVDRAVEYKGTFYGRGDIVTLPLDAGRKYASLKRLYEDQYGNYFAFVTWLEPSSTQTGPFNPDTYTIDEDDWYLRSFFGIEFVCHAPQNSPLLPVETNSQHSLLNEVGYVLERGTGECRSYDPHEIYSLLSGETCHSDQTVEHFWGNMGQIKLDANERKSKKVVKRKQGPKRKAKHAKR